MTKKKTTTEEREVSSATTFARASGLPFSGGTYSPYDAELYKLLNRAGSQHYLYATFDESYRSNPYTRGFVDYLYRHIVGSGWHVEGPGASVVEDFFKTDGTVSKLNTGVLFPSCLYGNGFMDFKTKGVSGPLSSTRILRPHDIHVRFADTDIGKLDYGRRIYEQDGVELRASHLFHLLLNPAPFDPLSESPLRPTLLFLTMLHDSNGDIGMALKRAAYSPYLAKLDLEGLSTEEKADAIREFGREMENVQSAKTNWVVDKKNEIGFVGALGGGAGAMSLPAIDLLSPVVSICMLSFGIPLGMFLQTGANKSILREQIEDSIIFYNNIRNRFRTDVENTVFPRITDQEVELVWDMPSLSGYEMKETVARLTELIGAGVISAQQAADYINFDEMAGIETRQRNIVGDVISGKKSYEDLPPPREVA